MREKSIIFEKRKKLNLPVFKCQMFIGPKLFLIKISNLLNLINNYIYIII